MINKKKYIILFILLTITLIVITDVPQRFLRASDNIYVQMKRFMDVFTLIQNNYVEDVDSENVMTGAIQGMLDKDAVFRLDR